MDIGREGEEVSVIQSVRYQIIKIRKPSSCPIVLFQPCHCHYLSRGEYKEAKSRNIRENESHDRCS